MRVSKQFLWVFISGMYLFAFSFRELPSQQAPSLFKVGRNGKYGYADRSGRIVVSIKFDEAGDFSEGLAPAGLNGKYGYVDTAGKLAIKLQYEQARSFSQGRAAVRLDKKWGFIDRTGLLVIPATFFACNSFADSLALVLAERPALNLPRGVSLGTGAEVTVISKKLGYIDQNGKFRIPASLEGEVRGIITKEGFDALYIISPKNFSEGMAPVRTGDRWGFINTMGKAAIASKFKATPGFSESLAGVQLDDNSCGYIDKTGRSVIPGSFESVCSFSEGLACVSIHGKWGYIDKAGRLLIPAAFEEALSFSRGRAAVRRGTKWGFIDAKGSAIIPFKFDAALPFGNGLAKVMLGRSQFYLDETGKTVFASDR